MICITGDTHIPMMRGEIYEIDGKRIFTLGGANSHDKKHTAMYEKIISL